MPERFGAAASRPRSASRHPSSFQRSECPFCRTCASDLRAELGKFLHERGPLLHRLPRHSVPPHYPDLKSYSFATTRQRHPLRLATLPHRSSRRLWSTQNSTPHSGISARTRLPPMRLSNPWHRAWRKLPMSCTLRPRIFQSHINQNNTLLQTAILGINNISKKKVTRNASNKHFGHS